MKYTNKERQAKYNKLMQIYDRLLEQDCNNDSLIQELELQLEMVELDETKEQIDKCRADRIITIDVHEITIRAINFKKQSLIDQLTTMIRKRQAEINLMIG